MFAVAILLTGAQAAILLWLMPPKVAPYLVGFAVASAGWALREVLVLTSGMTTHRLGIVGEEWTAQALRGLRRREWVLVNHVMLESSDIDHVLIGPGGFFAIETKFRSDWSCGVRDARQIADRTWEAARALESRLGLRVREPRVVPLVAMWGPGLTDDIIPDDPDVRFLAGDELAAYLDSIPPTIPRELRERCAENLDAYVRVRDTGEDVQHGQRPRSADRRALDVPIVLGSALLTLLGLVRLTSLAPEGLWTVAGAAVVTALAWLCRRRWPRSARTRHVTTTIITTAVGVAAIVGTVAATVLWR